MIESKTREKKLMAREYHYWIKNYRIIDVEVLGKSWGNALARKQYNEMSYYNIYNTKIWLLISED